MHSCTCLVKNNPWKPLHGRPCRASMGRATHLWSTHHRHGGAFVSLILQEADSRCRKNINSWGDHGCPFNIVLCHSCACVWMRVFAFTQANSLTLASMVPQVRTWPLKQPNQWRTQQAHLQRPTSTWAWIPACMHAHMLLSVCKLYKYTCHACTYTLLSACGWAQKYSLISDAWTWAYMQIKNDHVRTSHKAICARPKTAPPHNPTSTINLSSSRPQRWNSSQISFFLSAMSSTTHLLKAQYFRGSACTPLTTYATAFRACMTSHKSALKPQHRTRTLKKDAYFQIPSCMHIFEWNLGSILPLSDVADKGHHECAGLHSSIVFMVRSVMRTWVSAHFMRRWTHDSARIPQ